FGHRALNEAQTPNDNCVITPLFSEGIYKFGPDVEESLNSVDLIEDEIKSIGLDRFTHILMHTSSPWYLAALARLKSILSARKLAAGLIMPPSFWRTEGQTTENLVKMQRLAFAELRSVGTYFYSEAWISKDIPIMYAPKSRDTITFLTRPDASCFRKKNWLTFGYCGSTYARKGFSELCAALKILEKHKSNEWQVSFLLAPSEAETA